MAIEIPLFLEKKGYTAKQLRRAFGGVDPIEQVISGLKVSPGSGLAVAIGSGTADIEGSSAVQQGIYRCSSTTVATRTHDAANAINPRIDRVVMHLYDSTEAGSGADKGDIEIVKGTAQSGASFTNEGTWPALPSSSIELAVVLIPAGSSSVGAIFDRRPRLAGMNLVATTETWIPPGIIGPEGAANLATFGPTVTIYVPNIDSTGGSMVDLYVESDINTNGDDGVVFLAEDLPGGTLWLRRILVRDSGIPAGRRFSLTNSLSGGSAGGTPPDTQRGGWQTFFYSEGIHRFYLMYGKETSGDTVSFGNRLLAMRALA